MTVHICSPVCRGITAWQDLGYNLSLGSGEEPLVNCQPVRHDLGRAEVGSGGPQDFLACDHLALSSRDKEWIASKVFGALTFYIDYLAGGNGCPYVWRGVFVSSCLPDLLEPGVLQGEVLASVLIPGEV